MPPLMSRPPPQPTQTLWLTKKFFITYWRDPSFNGMRFLMTAAIALVLGTLYLGVGWTNLWDYIQLIEVCVSRPLTIIVDHHC